MSDENAQTGVFLTGKEATDEAVAASTELSEASEAARSAQNVLRAGEVVPDFPSAHYVLVEAALRKSAGKRGKLNLATLTHVAERIGD